jgi:hypothetical protein
MLVIARVEINVSCSVPTDHYDLLADNFNQELKNQLDISTKQNQDATLLADDQAGKIKELLEQLEESRSSKRQRIWSNNNSVLGTPIFSPEPDQSPASRATSGCFSPSPLHFSSNQAPPLSATFVPSSILFSTNQAPPATLSPPPESFAPSPLLHSSDQAPPPMDTSSLFRSSDRVSPSPASFAPISLLRSSNQAPPSSQAPPLISLTNYRSDAPTPELPAQVYLGERSDAATPVPLAQFYPSHTAPTLSPSTMVASKWAVYTQDLNPEQTRNAVRAFEYWEGLSPSDLQKHLNTGQCINCVRRKRGPRFCRMNGFSSSGDKISCKCCKQPVNPCIWPKPDGSYSVSDS